MNIRRFQIADFAEYKIWYDDNELNLHLGPVPDKEWLNHILTDKEGAQYAFLEKEALVGVMGIIFPDKRHPHYYITDVAVQPKLRRKGLGAKMLELLYGLHPLNIGESYKVFVDIKNKKAQLFFKNQGWLMLTEISDKDDMLSFTFKN